MESYKSAFHLILWCLQALTQEGGTMVTAWGRKTFPHFLPSQGFSAGLQTSHQNRWNKKGQCRLLIRGQRVQICKGKKRVR